MPSLEEELMGDQDPRAVCRLCRYIESLPETGENSQEEWDGVVNAKIGKRYRFTYSSIFRALKRRNAEVTKGSIENHRHAGHRE